MNKQYLKRPRYALSARPMWLEEFGEERGAWYESPAEARRAEWRARRHAALIAWVRMQMVQRLTARERECVELYYFEGLTLEAAGVRTQTNRSSVWRGVQRALRKLREARDEDDAWRKALRRIEQGESREGRV